MFEFTQGEAIDSGNHFAGEVASHFQRPGVGKHVRGCRGHRRRIKEKEQQPRLGLKSAKHVHQVMDLRDG
jgi:hypothetical protein